MNNQSIMVRDDARLSIGFTDAAIALKDGALAVSGVIGKVSNAAQQEEAVKAQTELARVLKLVEEARKAAKDPVLKLGREIDAKAKEFIAELEAEGVRVAGLVGEFQEAERIRNEAALRAQAEEATQLERERDAKLAAALNVQDADNIRDEYSQRIAATQQPITSARAEGQVVKQDWEIEVTNAYELARFHPACVKIEPRLSEIKQLLNEGVTVKGITAKKVTKASVRLGKEQPAISV